MISLAWGAARNRRRAVPGGRLWGGQINLEIGV